MKPASSKRWRPTRRGFLIAAGLGTGGLALGWNLGMPRMRLRMADSFLGPGESSFGLIEDTSPSSYFEVLEDGTIRLFATKIEMGQGLHTALAQIAAEELEIAPDRLEVVPSDTVRGPHDPSGTAGSNSVKSMYQPLREAAANLREMFRVQAASILDVPLKDVQIESGMFRRAIESDGDSSSLTYGEVLKAAELSPETWQVPEDAPALKPTKDFASIGEITSRLDIPAKVDGSARYAYDARAENMAYGAIARPPRIGARLTRASAGAAESVSGVIVVVIEDEFAGIVAESRLAARAGVAALDLEWSDGEETLSSDDIESQLKLEGRGGVIIQDSGDAIAELDALKPSVYEMYFRTPPAAHSPMEMPGRALRWWMRTLRGSKFRAKCLIWFVAGSRSYWIWTKRRSRCKAVSSAADLGVSSVYRSRARLRFCLEQPAGRFMWLGIEAKSSATVSAGHRAIIGCAPA